jgi:hypothetical protein
MAMMKKQLLVAGGHGGSAWCELEISFRTGKAKYYF